jgi:chromate transporter
MSIDLPIRRRAAALEVFIAFLRLGLTSFGGPIAHLGYFRTEFVERRRWLDDHAYADLVALCQFLPGPASSQVGIALGLFRAGWWGAISAWIGFTLPSAIALTIFGLVLRHAGVDVAWLHGLKVLAVAVVAQALWGMGRTLSPDRPRATVAVAAAVALIALPSAGMQLAVIALGGLIGARWLRPESDLPHRPFPLRVSKRMGVALLVAFFALLVALPTLAQTGGHALQVADAFYRAGALVFGGGHVVLPLLQSETVARGWVSNDVFLAGYGAAQAVPGPLFTFAAYLGASFTEAPNGALGAALALVAIFLPAFLLVIGALPLWEEARRHPSMQRAMLGVNAAVVGVLLAAFYDPVWVSAIRSPADFGLAAAAFLLLVFWKVPPWLVVIGCAAAAGLGWH